MNYYLTIVEGNEIRGNESDFLFCHLQCQKKHLVMIALYDLRAQQKKEFSQRWIK